MLPGTHSVASLTSLTDAKIKKIAILLWWLRAQVFLSLRDPGLNLSSATCLPFNLGPVTGLV